MQPLFQSTSKERVLVSVACYNDLSLNDQGRHAIIHIMFHDSDWLVYKIQLKCSQEATDDPADEDFIFGETT